MPADKVATWSLNLGGNVADVAPEFAASLEGVRAKVQASQDALKGYQGSLRALKGSSDEVAAAKEQLKAKIDAEKGALSQATLALLKQGTTYEQLNKKAVAAKKEQGDASKKFSEGLKAAGGPLAELNEKVSLFKELAEGTGGKVALVTLAVGALAAGVVELGAKVVDAGIRLGKFIVLSANELRSMGLLREATAGSAENAKNLGTWVDRLSSKVSTSKDKLNEMATVLTGKLSGGLSRASGRTIVTTFEAMAKAADAAGPEMGAKIQEVIERGRMLNRLQLSPQDLDKLPLRFYEVADALAKNMHVGVDQAKAALFEGRVPLEVGATAIRDAVNKKFGGINADKLLDVNVQIEKAGEKLRGLAKNVALDPLLKGMSKVFDQLDAGTENGKKLQDTFTKIGDAIAKFSEKHADDVVNMLGQLVDLGGKAVDIFDKWEPKIEGTIETLGKNTFVIEGLKAAAMGVGVVIEGIAIGFAALGVAAVAAAAVLGLPFTVTKKAYDWAKEIKWSELGKSIIDGLIGGLNAAKDKLIGAVKNVAGWIKSAFTGKDGIDAHSPSKVFEKYGEYSGAGYEQGLGKSKPGVQAAADDMAPRPSSAGAAGGAGAPARAGAMGGITVAIGSVEVTVNMGGGAHKADGEAIGRAAETPILRALTRAIREAMVTQGIPTQPAPVTP